MTAAHYYHDDFRGSPTPTCDRCGRDKNLRKVKVSGKPETLCDTCRAVLDCQPVWIDDKEYRVPKHNPDIHDV